VSEDPNEANGMDTVGASRLGMRHQPAFPLFALAASVISACDPSVSVINVMSGCPDMPLRGPAQFEAASPDDVIDDFEDNDMSLARAGGRTGSWVGYETPATATVFGEPSAECVAHGKYSGHLIGNNLAAFASNWNGVLIDPFAMAIPFDASAYSGFSFWVATGDSALAPLSLPVGVMTTDTAAGGGICEPCGDYYRLRRSIPLTHSWTRWVVKFSDLAQSGQGRPQVPLRANQLVSLMIWPENTYDIWIDDLRFER
jgi:hypothetical protein